MFSAQQTNKNPMNATKSASTYLCVNNEATIVQARCLSMCLHTNKHKTCLKSSFKIDYNNTFTIICREPSYISSCSEESCNSLFFHSEILDPQISEIDPVIAPVSSILSISTFVLLLQNPSFIVKECTQTKTHASRTERRH